METLLDPSVLYAPVVLPMLDEVAVHGLAHITGGGLPGNTTRILPSELDAVIDAGSWPRPPVFAWLSARGEIPEEEMFRTFNMGIGFVVVVESADADRIIDLAGNLGLGAWVIGRVAPGTGDVVVS